MDYHNLAASDEFAIKQQVGGVLNFAVQLQH